MKRDRTELLGILLVLKPQIQDRALQTQIVQTLCDNGVKSVEDLQRMYRGA